MHLWNVSRGSPIQWAVVYLVSVIKSSLAKEHTWFYRNFPADIQDKGRVQNVARAVSLVDHQMALLLQQRISWEGNKTFSLWYNTCSNECHLVLRFGILSLKDESGIINLSDMLPCWALSSGLMLAFHVCTVDATFGVILCKGGYNPQSTSWFLMFPCSAAR